MLDIQHLLQTYQLPAIFLGSFFFGETVILSAAFLAGQGLWSTFDVFWISFLGTILSDSIWFWLGAKLMNRVENNEKHRERYKKIVEKINTYAGNRPFLALLFIKFAYGTRILTIMYLSVRKVLFSLFALFDSVGTIIWLIVMIAIGYLAGKGTANYLGTIDNIEYSALALILFIVAFRALYLWIQKRIFPQ